MAINANNILGQQFGVSITRKSSDALQGTDKEKLMESLGITRDEPTQNITYAPTKVLEKDQTEKQEVQEMIEKYEVLVSALEELKVALKAKLKGRTVKVDPAINPAVRDAIRRLFEVNSDTINLDMFMQALELRTKLSEKTREETYGPRN